MDAETQNNLNTLFSDRELRDEFFKSSLVEQRYNLAKLGVPVYHLDPDIKDQYKALPLREKEAFMSQLVPSFMELPTEHKAHLASIMLNEEAPASRQIDEDIASEKGLGLAVNSLKESQRWITEPAAEGLERLRRFVVPPAKKSFDWLLGAPGKSLIAPKQFLRAGEAIETGVAKIPPVTVMAPSYYPPARVWPTVEYPRTKQDLADIVRFPGQVVAETVKSGVTPALVASIPLGGIAGVGGKVGQGAAQAFRAGKVFKGAGMTAQMLGRSGLEAATGIPAARGATTLAGATVIPFAGKIVSQVGKVADVVAPAVGTAADMASEAVGEGRIGQRFGTAMTSFVRKHAYPDRMQKWIELDQAAPSVLAKEFFGYMGDTLPENLRLASRRVTTEAERGVREGEAYFNASAEKMPFRHEQYRAADLVEGATKADKRIDNLTMRREVAAWNRHAESLRRDIVRSGFPEEAFERLRDNYLGRHYISGQIPMDTAEFIPRGRGRNMQTQATGRMMERTAEQQVGSRLPVKGLGARGAITIAQERYLAAFGRFQQDIIKTPGMVSRAKPGPGWVQLPAKEVDILPELAGKYVPLDVAREMMAHVQDAFYLSGRGMSGLGRLVRNWKTGVTAWNPKTWSINFLGNAMIADAYRLGAPYQTPFLVAKSAKGMLANDAMTQRALKAGLFEKNYEARGKLRRVLLGAIAETPYAAFGKGSLPAMSLDAVFNVEGKMGRSAAGVAESVSSWYQAQDDVWRRVAFEDGLLRGMKDDAAAARAKTMFGDYRANPYWVRRIGRSRTMIQPFIGWQYAVVPRYMKALSENPMAAQRWVNFMDAWNHTAAEEMGVPPDTVDRYKEMRANMQPPGFRAFAEHSPVLMMGSPMASGSIGMMDLGTMVPYGNNMNPARSIAVGPAVSSLVDLIPLLTGRDIHGRMADMPKEDYFREVARNFSLPIPVVRNIAKVGLLNLVEWDKDGNPNWAGRMALDLFEGYELAPRADKPAMSWDEMAKISVMPAPRPVDMGLEMAEHMARIEQKEKAINETQSRHERERIQLMLRTGNAKEREEAQKRVMKMGEEGPGTANY